MESYQQVLSKDTSLILSTDSPLFQLFKSFTAKPVLSPVTIKKKVDKAPAPDAE